MMIKFYHGPKRVVGLEDIHIKFQSNKTDKKNATIYELKLKWK